MAEAKESYKVHINEPTVVAPVGGERVHASRGQEVTVPAEDAFNLVQSGKATLVDGELPNELKQAQRKK